MNTDEIRRRFPRANISLSAWGGSDPRTEPFESFNAVTRDVAARGACLVMNRPGLFEQGQEVFLGIEWFRGEVPIKARGAVRWVEGAKGPGRQTLGIEFIGMRTIQDYERWLELIAFYEP